MYVVGCGGLMICFSLHGSNFRSISDSGGGFGDFEGSWPSFMVVAAANWMLYNVLDTRNFVIPGSPVEVWVTESYRKTYSKNQLRKSNEFSEGDILVVVVGSSFFYDELSLDYDVAMRSIGPLLIKYARRDDARRMTTVTETDEAASHLGLLQGSVRHYGLNGDVNSVLLMADIVLYGSTQDVQGFPPLLIHAMTFGIPVIAPDFVVDGVHMILFRKHNPNALMNAFSLMISNEKLSKFA
ncbi:hypothetical protein C1H46_005351 [Malus baccata]|uniref:Glycosyl transferase family 1 domain-containing protein n=1 Tax=Malus baccata TaxID=106549 RepID=A0A540ND63_MALBA|nr:hypothetical protein C1H46_005351 [Malus baccata]